MKKLKGHGKNLIAAAFWLCLWWILSAVIAKPLLLPSPPAVAERLLSLIATAAFWQITAVSLLRILLGLLSALVLGCALAVLTSRYELLHILFAPVLTVVKATPVASFIILALIWMGRDILPSFIALLIVLPIVWANVSAGIKGTDRQLLEAARVFRFSKWQMFSKLYVPSVMPHFISACRSALGMAWKAGIAAEVLTVPSLSVGKMLFESKLYLETTDLFAWTVVVILCSLIIEKLLMSAVDSLGRKYCR